MNEPHCHYVFSLNLLLLGANGDGVDGKRSLIFHLVKFSEFNHFFFLIIVSVFIVGAVGNALVNVSRINLIRMAGEFAGASNDDTTMLSSATEFYWI